MLRKITAVIFMLVMALLITLKHPVLGYCLCLDAYFTGDCVCQVEKPAAPAVSQDSASTCPSACANCALQVENENSVDTDSQPLPCDDCTKHLNLDVGDFVWQSTAYVPADTGFWLPLPAAFAPDAVQFSLVLKDTPMSIRGGPPPGLIDDGLPLYLRHSVLRL